MKKLYTLLIAASLTVSAIHAQSDDAVAAAPGQVYTAGANTAAVYRAIGNLVKTADPKDISVAGLQRGRYLIRVASEGKTRTAKFIQP